ncbi:hypothetical protein ACRE_070520 [Hapsidospora chrysogenum ATCC 11550]|uniref:Uncharacterized protein n=1 Tax=Hapsidospora chrysogenum (strain ATCC 11550 / CBS 779.69 / DSM 880 / IAM 14645 / JCM 23072 / IMI 49137) TaxID=857340 RepID=A0A086SYQ7_HAPC1|nr:hypothetical protein ACRE_070520 [Hapsidospora chrysogenum ATCC 11550]
MEKTCLDIFDHGRSAIADTVMRIHRPCSHEDETHWPDRSTYPSNCDDLVDRPRLVWADKFAGGGMTLTLATAVGGSLTGLYSWIDPMLLLARVMDSNQLLR